MKSSTSTSSVKTPGDEFHPVTRDRPCEICQHTRWCRRSGSGGHECHHCTDPAVGPFRRVAVTPGGFGVYRLHGENGNGQGSAAPSRPKPKVTKLHRTAEEAAQAAARDAGGELVKVYQYSGDFCRARIKLPDGDKTYRPIMRRKVGWGVRAPDRPWPLYGAGDLPADVRVYVCEGEKATDAVRSIGLPAVTSGACDSAGFADWTPLAGRDVTILPDHDEAGERYARAVAEQLARLDPPARVSVLRLPGLQHAEDAHEFVHELRDGHTADEIRMELEAMAEAAAAEQADGALPMAVDAADLLAEPLEMAEPIIHDLLRRGEIATLTSNSKARKSWSALQLCVAIATGGRWFDLQCRPGRALLIDCELQRATLRARLGTVLHAAGLGPDSVRGRLEIATWRGRRTTIESLCAFLESIPEGRFDLVVLDPLYKLYPAAIDENSNADMARFYGDFVGLAERVGAALLLCCHTPKGNTGERATIDLAAGAGAAGRAVDVAIALRAHEASAPGSPAIVRETIARSFPDLQPVAFRWSHPAWVVARDLDPAALAGRRKPKARAPAAESAPAPAPKRVTWDMETFVHRFVGDKPRSKAVIAVEAMGAGLTDDKRVRDFLRAGVETGVIHRWKIDGQKGDYYATIRQPDKAD